MIEKSRDIVYNLTMGNIDYLTNVRRALHKIPELSEREFKTSEFIANELSRMKHKFRKYGTGVVCDVKGDDGSVTVALRCDIDALPITEKSDCPFKADSGNMHACGHDGHTAMLLCVAEMLTRRRPKTDV